MIGSHAAKAEAPSCLASARPTSSAFTISATTPYTAAVIPIPTSASTSDCIHRLPAGSAPSVIAMISAERMKSVLMALATFSSSTVWALQRDRAELGFMLMGMMRQNGLEHFLHPFVAEVGAAEHQ